MTSTELSYFWSPEQGDTLEAEVARNGPLSKILLSDFLMLLCKEAEWLESNMLDLLPELFRETNQNQNGHLSR